MIRHLHNPTSLLIGAATVATLTLAGAFGFQHIGGLEPCPLCIWQRWPYVIGTVLIVIALLGAPRPYARALPVLAALTFAIGFGLSVWHAGFEYGWWPGPSNCASPIDFGNQSAQELLQTLEGRRPVRCDIAPWTFAGLSLAGWGAVVLAGLTGATARACVLLRLRGPVPRPSTGSPSNSRGGS